MSVSDDVASGKPLDMTALLSVLQSYSTTSEVRYFIDEAITNFTEKRLPPLVAELASRTPAPAANLASPPPASTPGPVDTDWLAMVVRAHVAADVEAQVRRAVHKEVAHQLDERLAAMATPHRLAPSSALPPRPPLPPSPRRGTTEAAAMVEARATSPPPPTPSTPPRRSEGEGARGGDASPTAPDTPEPDDGRVSVDSATPPPPTTTPPRPVAGEEDTAEAGRRQRERILAAIRDVEHQLSGLQRQVNELAHQQRLGQQRVATLFTAAHHTGEGGDDSPGAHGERASAPASLNASCASGTGAPTAYTTLLAALDARELGRARELARDALTALAPPPLARPPTPHPSASAARPEVALQTPLLDDAPLPWTAPLRDGGSHGGEGDSGVVASGGGRGGSSVPPPAPTLQPSYRGSAPASAPTSAAVSAAAQQLALLLDSGSGQRGQAGAAREPAHTPPGRLLNLSPSVHTSGSGNDSPPAITARTSAAIGTNPAPAPSPLRAYMDAATVGHAHRHGQRTAGTPHQPRAQRAQGQRQQSQTQRGQDITLGVDAVDLPAGVLPSALGLRGGVRVLAVSRGQLAERSGVTAGDVVLAAAGVPVETCAQLQRALREAGTGPLRVELYRQSANLIFTITLDT